MATCSSCGRELSESARFCPSCGTAVEQTTLPGYRPEAIGTTCPQCGSTRLEGAKFCGRCGATFADEADFADEATADTSVSRPNGLISSPPPPAGLTPALSFAGEASGGGGPATPAAAQPSSFADFVTFRRMITPVVIQIIFWLAEIINVVIWITFMTRWSRTVDYLGNSSVSARAVLIGILLMLVSALLIRIYLELLIVIFRINENVLAIRRDAHFG